MFFPIKDRKINQHLELFVNNIQLDKHIYVPFLSDGCFELMLAKNNFITAKPINNIFNNLWENLLKNPKVISKMIEISSDDNFNVLEGRNKIVNAYNLLNLTRRSNENVLFNNNLLRKDLIFNQTYLKSLNNFKTSIELGNFKKNMSTFQDLTYLNSEDKLDLLQYEDCLFITKSEKDCALFENFNIDKILDYYILWSKK
tara:strand:- start:65 stop:664 length:600 start_codon:yes stop_codon:yes gene_type:complete